MADQFNKWFLKDYRFWTLVISGASLIAMIFFASQAFKIQTTLKSIEETQKKAHFAKDCEIHFNVGYSKNKKLETAEYNFLACNKSSHVFKDFEPNIKLIFEHPNSREEQEVEVFTAPKNDLLPSDKPIYLIPNPQLSETIRNNIVEFKKQLSNGFKPKHFLVTLEWNVKISKEESLKVKKIKYILIEQFI
jgi:hypothetical protein